MEQYQIGCRQLSYLRLFRAYRRLYRRAPAREVDGNAAGSDLFSSVFVSVAGLLSLLGDIFGRYGFCPFARDNYHRSLFFFNR